MPLVPAGRNFHGRGRASLPLLLNCVGSVFILNGWPFSRSSSGLGSNVSTCDGPALHEQEDDAPGPRPGSAAARREPVAAGATAASRAVRPVAPAGRPGRRRRTRRRSGGASPGGSAGARGIVRSGACPVPSSDVDPARCEAAGSVQEDEFLHVDQHVGEVRPHAGRRRPRSGGTPSSPPAARGTPAPSAARPPSAAGRRLQVHPPDPSGRVEPLDRPGRASAQSRGLLERRTGRSSGSAPGPGRSTRPPADRGRAGGGMSKASSIGVRKFRRTLM